MNTRPPSGPRRWTRVACLAVVAVAVTVLAGCTTKRSTSDEHVTVSTTISTPDGSLRGARDGDVVRFRGVPYAQPPTGDRRFAPPAAVAPWTGTRDALQSGPPCAQPGDAPTGSTAEDCLHLDLTVPAASTSRPRPVLVWLHGGGFTTGAGRDIDPRRLAVRGDVAVVTVEFRLGVLANLALPGMTDAGSYGLQDQRAALQWVQRTARAFGADAGNVTLAGQSGGAVAVCGQLTTPAARDLFAQAVLQSGSCATTLGPNASGPGTPAFGTFWRPLTTALTTGAQAAAALGCPDAGAALACLRRVPVDQLLTQSGVATAAVYGTPALPDDPATTSPVGDRPVLSGTTHDEQRLVSGSFALVQRPITAADYPQLLDVGFGPDATAVAGRYPATGDTTAADAWAAAYTDSGYVCPQVAVNDRLVRHGPVFGYEFADPTAPPVIPSLPGFDAGASHASELFYLFDVTTGPVDIDGNRYSLTDDQQRLADTMIDAWSTFLHTGRPGPAASWPAWNHTTTVHQFTADADHPTTTNVATTHHCPFWRTVQ